MYSAILTIFNDKRWGNLGMIRAGLIGYGAIGKTLESALASRVDQVQLVGVFDHLHRGGKTTLKGWPFVPDLEKLLEAGPHIVIECAGQDAVKTMGPRLLGAGIDLVVASVGALADAATERALRSAAESGGGRLIIPSGAIAGLDGIAAARIAGIDRVVYQASKPPRAWKGTAAEDRVDLESLTAPVIFFRGNARDACARFPQNANVTAAIALAGIGFDKTEVALAADPGSKSNAHHVVVEGPFGRIEISLTGNPLPDNPKTSMLAAYSLVSCLLQRLTIRRAEHKR